MAAAEHEQFRALLESAHVFPGPFLLTVITVTDDAVAARLRVAIEAERTTTVASDEWVTRPSSGGRYTSHRVNVRCESADDVVALYVRVRAVPGVVTVL